MEPCYCTSSSSVLYPARLNWTGEARQSMEIGREDGTGGLGGRDGWIRCAEMRRRKGISACGGEGTEAWSHAAAAAARTQVTTEGEAGHARLRARVIRP